MEGTGGFCSQPELQIAHENHAPAMRADTTLESASDEDLELTSCGENSSRSPFDESGNQRRNHADMVPADRRLIKFGARG